jgi:putative hydrolase of the HAD superfamily
VLTDLIFDFFGTLVSYDRARFHGDDRRAFTYLRSQGFPLEYPEYAARFDLAFRELERAAATTCREFHMDDAAETLFAAAGWQASHRTRDRFVALFVEEWNRGTVFLDGIAEFLSRLASRYRLSVLSNSNYPPVIHDNLRAMGVVPLFSQIVVSADLGIRKPSPEIFRHTLRLLDARSETALYVGDTYDHDYLGAQAAHLRCCLIDAPRQHADGPMLRIDHLLQLPSVLARLEGAAESG